MKSNSWCKRHYPLIIILAVLIIDQGSKFFIKLTMRIGDEIPVFDWFRIHFLENKGMAFGFSFGGDGGKLLLSLIRLVAIALGFWYLAKLNRFRMARCKNGERFSGSFHPKLCFSGMALNTSLLVSLSLILAGAIGNMIDSAFYGLIFSESYFHVAELFPASGGYAPFLHGHVVDMLYFPLLHGYYPDWFPWVGGQEFLFFRPVFNIADSSITIGFFLFILTQRSFWWPGSDRKKSSAAAGKTETGTAGSGTGAGMGPGHGADTGIAMEKEA